MRQERSLQQPQLSLIHWTRVKKKEKKSGLWANFTPGCQMNKPQAKKPQ